MTDSMKFGPEWLRNMSADITSISSNVGQNTTSATMSSSVTTATSSTNSTTSPNTGSSLSNINNNTNQSQINLLTNTPIPRNLFPEFRYGREEMLSLFEKTCSMPEILPSYKNLYVEKVQYPLALTPSSEEEMVAQGPSLPSVNACKMKFAIDSRASPPVSDALFRTLDCVCLDNWNYLSSTLNPTIATTLTTSTCTSQEKTWQGPRIELGKRYYYDFWMDFV
uniref:Uncharacterized protein n=1 Tax=Glossina austeni TaxID=7395 RepID=A0A1A9UIA4_GLOAU